MKKIYYLSSCNTCRRIIKEVNPDASFIMQDVKEMPISTTQLDHLKGISGSYSSLLNRQARMYRELSLHTQDLSELQIRTHILSNYTLLKRPVFIVDNKVFIGNNRKVVAELIEYMQTIR